MAMDPRTRTRPADTRWRVALAAIVVTLLVAACGGTATTSPAASAAAPPAASAAAPSGGGSAAPSDAGYTGPDATISCAERLLLQRRPASVQLVATGVIRATGPSNARVRAGEGHIVDRRHAPPHVHERLG